MTQTWKCGECSFTNLDPDTVIGHMVKVHRYPEEDAGLATLPVENGHKVYIVAVYDVAQQYGGPEEGGWWYDVGSFIRQVRQFRSEGKALSYCRRLNDKLRSRVFGPNQNRREFTSVLSDGELQAYVHEDICPKGFPDHRPHYE